MFSKLISNRLLWMLFIFLTCNELSVAAWDGPTEIIIGKWGSGINEFGIEYGDTEDRTPWLTAILNDGKIVIDDGVNERIVVYYPTGNIFKVVPWYLYDNNKNKKDNPEYPLYQYWNFRAYTKDGYIWFKIDDYLLKTPSGELLNKTSTYPSDLGVVQTKPSAIGQNEITITYPDKKYVLASTSRRYNHYIRDKFSNLYGISGSIIDKYNSEGRLLGQLIVQGDKHNILIDFTGNVFTLQTTTNMFKVLKWTWKD